MYRISADDEPPEGAASGPSSRTRVLCSECLLGHVKRSRRSRHHSSSEFGQTPTNAQPLPSSSSATRRPDAGSEATSPKRGDAEEKPTTVSRDSRRQRRRRTAALTRPGEVEKTESGRPMPPPHTAPERQVCERCDKTFSNRSNLRKHQRVHTGERPFRCRQCDSTFGQLVNLKTHLRVHTGEKPFHCAQCDTRFSKLCHLNTHRRVHTGEKPFHCTRCHTSFNRLDSMKRHLSRHLSRQRVVVGVRCQ